MNPDNNNPLHNNNPIGGPAPIPYEHEPSLEPELLLIKSIFSEQINTKKAEATDKLEAGQDQVKVLDKLLGAIDASSTPEGFKISEDLKRILNSQWDFDTFEQTQENKELLDILKKIKEAIESKGIPNFQPLFAFLNAHPQNSIANKLKDLGIVDGVQPSNEQIKQFSEVIADKEAKNNTREYRKEQHEKLLQLLKDSGIVFQAQPYKQENFEELFKHLAANPAHPLNHELAQMGISPQKKPTADQLKSLADLANSKETTETREIRKLLRDTKIIAVPENFTKQQTKNILHHIRNGIKEKEAFNNVQSRKISELDAQLNKMFQSLMAALRTLNDIIKKIASNIRGG